MKPVKTMQKYKCDFCSKRLIKSAMEIHEKRCFRNPNRFCEYCKNKGTIREYEGDIGYHETDCPYCSSFDANKLKEIEAREEQERQDDIQENTDSLEEKLDLI